jgi:hypothetical protein
MGLFFCKFILFLMNNDYFVSFLRLFLEHLVWRIFSGIIILILRTIFIQIFKNHVVIEKAIYHQ